MADIFLHHIILRHGAPRILLSDRGRTFLSNVLEELLRVSHTVHKTTSGYHRQTNGLTERFHRTLSDMMYISPEHRNWDLILPFVTSTYNTAVQHTTRYSPFFLISDHSPTYTFDSSFLPPVSSDSPPHEPYTSRLRHCRQTARSRTEAPQQDRETRYTSTHRSVRFHQETKCFFGLIFVHLVCVKNFIVLLVHT